MYYIATAYRTGSQWAMLGLSYDNKKKGFYTCILNVYMYIHTLELV